MNRGRTVNARTRREWVPDIGNCSANKINTSNDCGVNDGNVFGFQTVFKPSQKRNVLFFLVVCRNGNSKYWILWKICGSWSQSGNSEFWIFAPTPKQTERQTKTWMRTSTVSEKMWMSGRKLWSRKSHVCNMLFPIRAKAAVLSLEQKLLNRIQFRVVQTTDKIKW